MAVQYDIPCEVKNIIEYNGKNFSIDSRYRDQVGSRHRVLIKNPFSYEFRSRSHWP